jgi:hypothetical protein
LFISLAPGRLAAQMEPQKLGLNNAKFTATLLSPMSSETSRKNDHFTAAVQTPSRYRGAILTGIITESKQPSKGFAGLGARKNAEMAFQFEILTYRNVQYPVAVNLTQVANKHGVKGVDDEGHVVGATSEKKPALAALLGLGTGAVIGGLTHLGVAKGAAIGAGAGLVIGLTMTTQAESIQFSPGTVFTLNVSDPQRESEPMSHASRQSAESQVSNANEPQDQSVEPQVSNSRTRR